MAYGLIFSDRWNQYNDHRIGISRNISNHRVATFLREHSIDVDVIDFLHDFTKSEMLEVLDSVKTKLPEFIGVGTTTDKRYEHWDAILETIRSTLPDTKIIVFGERVMRTQYQGADFYIEGYAESAFLEVVQNCANIKFTLVDNCKLITAKLDYANDYKANSFSSKFLESDFINKNEAHHLAFSLGCIFKCSFCNHSEIGVKKSSHERNKQDIINEMLEAYEKWGITKFLIADSTFNDTQEKANILEEVAKLIPAKLEIMCFLRLDLLYKNPGIIDKLVASGVKAAHIGIDSLNKETGKLIGKVVDPEELKQYLLELKSKYPDLFLYGTFIAGLPKDTVIDQYKSLAWLETNNALDMWWWFPLSIKNDVGYNEVLSPIEQDYKSYGYTKINDVSIEASGRGMRDKNINVINWTNESMSMSAAVKLCNDINHRSRLKIKYNPWASSGASTVYKDYNWWLKVYHHEVNDIMEDVYANTTQFVADYKEKKLRYFKTF